MGPDQLLVLVNGKRRHAVATINSNNGIGRGTVPVDLNTLPIAAIERIEILRDGAAAQYGSDAIAGVINVVLRQDAKGSTTTAQGGMTERGEGATGILSERVGFKPGGDGFVVVTGEARYRDFTNSAETDPRVGRVTQHDGDPRSLDLDLTTNAEAASPWGSVYGFGTFADRRVDTWPLFRLPSVAPAVYPNGFLPQVREDMLDLGGTVGTRGSFGDWHWDLSDTIGYNTADFDVSRTVNTSLGTTGPSKFDGGGVRYGQNLIDLTIDRDVSVLAGAHIAAGIEQRHEWYRMRAGEPLSYRGAGAQGFPGYNPPTPVAVSRSAFSAFLDSELRPIDSLELGVATRYEHYSDFGSKTTVKGSLLWHPIRVLSLRASASTGFRAPSLQQQYFSTVTSQLSGGVLVNVGNFAATDPVARALGATPLRAETSDNYSGGIVLTPIEQFSFTADVYRILVHDRICLSESLTGPAVTAILLSHGINNASQVRFFTNTADTRTSGFEISAHWTQHLSADSLWALTAGYGKFDNRLTRLRQNPVLPQLPLLGLTSIESIVSANPANKLIVNGTLSWQRVHFGFDVSRSGSTRFANLGTVDQTFGPITAFDLTAGYDITRAVRVDFGVINVTDQFPDRLNATSNAKDGRVYLPFGGVGLNGREYFLRATASF
jgi:iron complex outermembrane receptor protein